jgi:hypothetical protein
MRAGKYRSLGCSNGMKGAHGCKLSTFKSVTIIESSLLRFLREKLISKQIVADVVEKANQFLAIDAAKPRIDTKPIQAKIRQLTGTIDKHFARMESATGNSSLVQAYEARIAEAQKELNRLKESLRDAEHGNAPSPPPLDASNVEALLTDLPKLLNQETPAAANAIRQLTGRIDIDHLTKPGKRGGVWIAKFTPDLTA